MSKRIGIFAGTFDPVHTGHVAFAVEAKKTAQLDRVYFLPEIQPRYKTGVTHIAHRIAMLNLALRPYSYLRVLEFPERQFSVASTLPRLNKHFKHDQLIFMMGSDTFSSLLDWALSGQLIKRAGVVVGIRGSHDLHNIIEIANKLSSPLREFHIIESHRAIESSSRIRGLLSMGAETDDLLSVQRYVTQNWLYSSVLVTERL